MDGIEIQFDMEEIENKLKDMLYVPSQAKLALKRALNKTIIGMRTDALNEIAKEYIIKKKDVRPKISITKANKSTMSAVLASTGKPIRLIRFKVKKNRYAGNAKKGVAAFAKVKRTSAGGYISNTLSSGKKAKAFITTFKSGEDLHKGVFVRVGSGRKIKQLYGPGVVQMLKDHHISNTIQQKAVDRFNNNLDHEIQYILSKGDK